MSKMLVTGGCGFIGSNLVDQLIDDGHEVVVIDDLSTGTEKNLNPKAEFHALGLLQINENRLEGIDTVFHLAAKARVQPSIEDPMTYHNTNVTGTLKLLQDSVKYKVRRFIFSSSSSVYGMTHTFPTSESSTKSPISPYAANKYMGEVYCKTFSEIYNLETICLRYFNVYGERQPTEGAYCTVMGIFARQLLEGNPMTINGDGEQRRDFTYVGDIVRGNILASTSNKVGNGEPINLGSGVNYSVNQLANLLGGDRVYREPVFEPKVSLADNTLALGLLGWRPQTKLEDWILKYKKDIGLV
jgi:UDP-glucose 4-epimerase